MKRELLRKPSVRIVAALATLSVLVIAPALVFAGPLVFHGAAQAGALSASSPRVTHDTHHDVSAPLGSSRPARRVAVARRPTISRRSPPGARERPIT